MALDRYFYRDISVVEWTFSTLGLLASLATILTSICLTDTEHQSWRAMSGYLCLLYPVVI